MYDLTLWQDDLFTRMSESFSDLFDRRACGLLPTLKKSGYPKINIYTEKDKSIIEATVPGLTNENVKVEWKDGILTINNLVKSNEEKKNRNYYVREIHQSSFSRSFDVSDKTFKVDAITANIENGILKITLPLMEAKEEPKAKQIQVQ